MLDLADLEYYCYAGVWSAGLVWREWIQPKDSRHHKKMKTDLQQNEEKEEKMKPSRLIWMLARMRSSMKQKCLKKAEESFESRCEASSKKEIAESLADISSEFPSLVLPKSGLHIPAGSHCISCGSFTEIRRVELSRCPVTLKRGKHEIAFMNSDILKKEINVLTKIHHPNILLLMGVVKLDEDNIVTIFEDASMGTLHHLLHFKKTVLPPMMVQKFMTQLCQAMIFLHDRGWIHTGISSHTIIVVGNFTLKLTGFETAFQSREEQINNIPNKALEREWYQWESPEQLQSRDLLSAKTDIFSVGLVFWEICTSTEPWRGYIYEDILKKYQSLSCALGPKALSPLIIPIESDIYTACLQRMLFIDAKERFSSFLQVLSQIQDLHSVSKNVSVSDYIQPPQFVGALKKAQLSYQPQPQRAKLASNTQQCMHDRDPYTGLRRVSDCRHLLKEQTDRTRRGKSHSTASLNEANLHFSTMNNGTKQSISHLENKTCLGKERTKTYFMKSEIRCPRNKDSFLPNNESCGSLLLQNTKVLNLDTNKPVIQKRNISSPKTKVDGNCGNSINKFSPIKPASHYNQKIESSRKGYSKSDDMDNQNGCILSQKLPLRSHQKFSWLSSNTPEVNQYTSNGSTKQDCGYQQLKGTSFSFNNAHSPFINSLKENQKQNASQLYNNQTSINYKDVNKSMFPSKNKQNIEEQQRTKQSDEHQSTSDVLLEINLKESEFESTDSGIFTTSKELDCETHQDVNPADSTEDLYFDDEFGLEMELDSHMQLLCLYDSSSLYNEHSFDTIEEDISMDPNS